jgi:hypothetical protein
MNPVRISVFAEAETAPDDGIPNFLRRTPSGDLKVFHRKNPAKSSPACAPLPCHAWPTS